jgi:polyisoprenoid-binding protein YceI
VKKINPVNYLILLTLLLFGVAFAQGAMQAVPKDKIDIKFISKQMNVPVEGKFKNATGQIAFDPNNPQQSKAQFEIDLNSIDLGLPDIETEVKKSAWFDTGKHPKATFVSSDIKPLGQNKFEAKGKLTIKGITKDVIAPVLISQKSGNASEASGSLTIKRLDFKIGEGIWSDTETVANEVQIKFAFPLPASKSK